MKNVVQIGLSVMLILTGIAYFVMLGCSTTSAAKVSPTPTATVLKTVKVPVTLNVDAKILMLVNQRLSLLEAENVMLSERIKVLEEQAAVDRDVITVMLKGYTCLLQEVADLKKKFGNWSL